MTNQELAELILQKFIPFAFTCGEGASYCEHPDCSEARLNSYPEYNTAMRIALFIQNLEK